MYQPIPAGQEKDFGNRRIYELQGGVNSEYLTGCAQVLSQDHLPSLGIVFVLLQGEQDRRQVMLEKDQTSLSQERYDLVANEGGVVVVAEVLAVEVEGVDVEEDKAMLTRTRIIALIVG